MATYQLITGPSQIGTVRQQFTGQRVIGVDTETTSLDPYAGQVRLLQLATPETVYILDLFTIPSAALSPIKEVLEAEQPVKIFHNAKFDAKMLLHHFGIEVNHLFDTMLASQLVSAGDFNQRQGLADVALRLLDQRIDKGLQTSNWSRELTPAMLEYAAQDAAVLIPLRQALVEKLKELRLIKAAQLEFECVLPIAAMEVSGIHLDRGCWEELIRELEATHARLGAEVRTELATAAQSVDLFGEANINLNSPEQVHQALVSLGVPIKSTREVELEPFARRYPMVAKLLEYRHVQKLLSTGRTLLDHLHPVTGRIHADFRQIGTPTGRMSCSEPNVQQIPNLPEVRCCFKSPPGKKLVVADYSQIELCILAEFSQDAKMIEAFQTGADLHRSTASLMLKVPLDQVTKEQRAMAKIVNYGLLYGMGAVGLAARIETTVAEAERLMARYFEVYQGVAEWLRAAADTAVAVKHSRTHWGRLWRFQFDPYDREQVATIQRLGKNAPIQGTSADILKRAMRLVYDGLKGREAHIVNSIHDELVVETDQTIAEEVAEIVQAQMVAAAQEFIRTIPVNAEVAVADAWMK